ncbi:MAG TPA: mannose-6-phosphate isomerase [Bacteroidales bacterium]|nr:mannose-6-phosphate isomerase [Bacteroidales bacterium]HPS16851.1 mannose-6-phosphate isomerase [Bacteroidales bacterium]
MNQLYPLKFKPIFKDKLWGGDKVNKLFGKNFSPLPNCGESWELSGVDENLSVVENGFLKNNNIKELIEVYMGDLVGEKVFEKFGLQFPILIKIIDSREWLSIQVHPDDTLAKKRHNENGKTEMWYILDADKNGELISGFNKEINKEIYLDYFEKNNLTEILNFEKVNKGDVFYIPSGRIHALGPGVCLAEIQQTSDITYRIFDWNRVDDKGNPRQLHTKEAVDAIDYSYQKNYRTNYSLYNDSPSNLVKSPYFTTNLLSLNKTVPRDYYDLDSFVILMCVEGSFDLNYHEGKEKINAGQTILIPAELNEIQIEPHQSCKTLEIYIE